jgi:hypothetical protein
MRRTESVMEKIFYTKLSQYGKLLLLSPTRMPPPRLLALILAPLNEGRSRTHGPDRESRVARRVARRRKGSRCTAFGTSRGF